MSNNTPKLPYVVEDYPEDYNLVPCLTLLEISGKHAAKLLVIVDIASPTHLSAYVLDNCSAEGLDEASIINMIDSVWEESKDKPLSVIFSKLGVANDMAKIHRTFRAADIVRAVGRVPVFDLTAAKTVRRRRRRDIQPIMFQAHPSD